MPDLNPLYYINVGPHGTFKESGDLQTTPQDIDRLFEHLIENNQSKLAVHFHGGLISEGAGKDIAEKMVPVYRDAGAHPVTFIWETGLVETLLRNINTIQRTELFKKLLKYVIKHAAKRLGANFEGKGPGEEITLEEIEAELQKEGAFESFDATAKGGAAQLQEQELDELEAEMEAELEIDLAADEDLETIVKEEAPQTDLLDQRKLDEMEDARARGVSVLFLAKTIAKIAYRVIKRYVKQRDHDFYPSVVEEVLREFYLADFGEWVWGGMKNAAHAMWKPNTPPVTINSHVGNYFLQKLVDWQNQNPDSIVDLIGHSAGSIAICNMLAAAEEQDLEVDIRHIIFLAPACTSRLFYNQIVTKPDNYQSFRMFTMADEFETQDQLVTKLYTHSLLYFISGVLEDDVDIPIAGMIRHATGESPYDDDYLKAIHDFLFAPGANRLVLSKTTSSQPGFRSHSVKHGDFDDDQLTRESLRTLVAI